IAASATNLVRGTMWPGGGWIVALRLQDQLVPGHIVPRTKFVADAAIDADELESACLMQPDARGIRQRDARARFEIALRSQQLEQRAVQCAAHAAAASPFPDIDGRVDRPLVRRSIVMAAGIRVAGHDP